MKQTTKLQPIPWGRISVFSIFGIVSFIAVFGVIRTVMAERAADMISGILYVGVTAALILAWVKARQTVVLPVILMNFVLTLHFFIGIRILAIILNVLLLVLFVYMFTSYLKHVACTRKVLELAALPVEDVRNGFTGRPYPSGKTVYSKGELYGFTEYLQKNLIAIPFADQNGIVISFPEDWFGRLWDMHGNYTDDTRVILQFDGQVSAHITEKDYNKYREKLTFDQLCASFGALFLEFIELYKNGESDLILEKIKSGSKQP